MFGLIKRVFGSGGESADNGGNALDALEAALMETSDQKLVDQAANLRNHLRRAHCDLSHDDKVRIVRALNKAKVRAIMGGTNESFSAFRCLDSITNDVVTLL